MFDDDIVVPMSGDKLMRPSDYMGGGEFSKCNMVRGEEEGRGERKLKIPSTVFVFAVA